MKMKKSLLLFVCNFYLPLAEWLETNMLKGK